MTASGTGRLARDVYGVAGEDRRLTPIARGARWIGTVVSGLFDTGDAPALSDIVIRRLSDGVEVRRIRESWVVEFEKTMRDVAADLDSSTPETFAEAWLRG